MIAAGSLFTSCVENTEPAGIKDLREAKAGYLDALSKVREADARYRDAETAVQQAIAAQEQAKVAQEQAIAKAKELANEATALDNDKKAAQIAADIEDIKAKAKQAAVKAEQDLAQAQADLEEALRKIAAEAIGLTWDEKEAIRTKTESLQTAQSNYHGALVAVEMAERAIWEKEYDLAAGYDINIAAETAQAREDYNQKIAASEEAIADAEAQIAADEALLEEPSEVEAYLKAFQDSVKAMQVDSLQVAQAKAIYEASALKEAQVQYSAAWQKFAKDSLAGYVQDFVFADEEGKPIAYDMNVVYRGVTNRVDNLFEWSAVNNALTTEFGLVFQEKDGFSQFVMPVADEEVTSKVLYGATGEKDTLGLVDIVSALKRDLVLVNGNDSAEAVKAVADAKKADSVYTTHRAILEAGLDSFSVYKAAKAAVKAYNDTAVVPAKAADSTAKAKVAADSDTIKAAVKAAAADYIAANKAFVDAVNDIVSGGGIQGGISGSDSAKFIKAVQNLGKAQAAYLGYTDSIVLAAVVDGKVKHDAKVSIADLAASGFVEKKNSSNSTVTSLYGGTGYGWFAGKTDFTCESNAWYSKGDDNYYGKVNPFSRVTRKIIGSGESMYGFGNPIKEENVAFSIANYKYDSKSPIAYTKTDQALADTVAFASKYTKGESIVAALATLATDKKAADDAAKALQTAENNLVKKEAGVVSADSAYIQIFKSFKGRTSSLSKEDSAACKKPQTFNWTAETFEDPFLCVWFNDNYTQIVDNPTLKTIIHSINPSADGNVTGGWIFKRDNWTEYALKLQAEQKAYVATHYTEILDQLANIEEAVDQACEDFETAYEAWKEQKDEYSEVLARLCGVNEDGVVRDQEPVLKKALAVSGEWNLGGYQKEWADEFAAEYPEIVADYLFQKYLIGTQIANTKKYIALLEECYVDYKNFVDGNHDESLKDMITRLKNDITTQKNNIVTEKAKIIVYEKALAEIEMGYDVTSIQLKVLYDELEVCQNNLKVAEEALARAQKEYDEVIAKYGVTE